MKSLNEFENSENNVSETPTSSLTKVSFAAELQVPTRGREQEETSL